jgi:hypothetical protein
LIDSRRSSAGRILMFIEMNILAAVRSAAKAFGRSLAVG